MNNDAIVKDLVSRAARGDQNAFSELKNMYEPLISSSVAKRTLPQMNGQDIEDLRQEALIIFCRALTTYDPSVGGVEFGLYAKICIENGLASYVRSFFRERRDMVVFPVDESAIGGAETVDPLQLAVDRERLGILIEVIQKSLSEYESRVWWLYASGLTASEIAARLGDVDARSVSNAIYRIRKKLRAELGSPAEPSFWRDV